MGKCMPQSPGSLNRKGPVDKTVPVMDFWLTRPTRPYQRPADLKNTQKKNRFFLKIYMSHEKYLTLQNDTISANYNLPLFIKQPFNPQFTQKQEAA